MIDALELPQRFHCRLPVSVSAFPLNLPLLPVHIPPRLPERPKPVRVIIPVECEPDAAPVETDDRAPRLLRVMARLTTPAQVMTLIELLKQRLEELEAEPELAVSA